MVFRERGDHDAEQGGDQEPNDLESETSNLLVNVQPKAGYHAVEPVGARLFLQAVLEHTHQGSGGTE
ncbi:MAG TPA: hypothetical protein VGD78_18455 [Chthoniobacterales bacterium]